MEQVTVLGHHPQRPPRIESKRQVADVDAAEPDGAGVDVVQPGEQLRDGRLARAGRADQRDHLAGLDRGSETPCSTSTPPRVSSTATSSSEASETLSADG